jgi:hypothetical protein
LALHHLFKFAERNAYCRGRAKREEKEKEVMLLIDLVYLRLRKIGGATTSAVGVFRLFPAILWKLPEFQLYIPKLSYKTLIHSALRPDSA